MSASNTYQSTELFSFFSHRRDLEDASQLSVPVYLSWTRVGQYLPWMRVGQKPGKLVYHTQGSKLMKGWEELPEDIKAWVEENAPDYKNAPTLGLGSNMTSWRYIKQQMDDGRYASACDE